MIAIRPMTLEDIPAARQVWQATEGMILRDVDSPESLSRYLARNPGCSFVAEDDSGNVVGVALAGHDGRRGYLNHVAVVAEYRGRGIGTKLVDACRAALAREGIEKVHLFVFETNAAGKKYWQNRGWRERRDIVLMSAIMTNSENA